MRIGRLLGAQRNRGSLLPMSREVLVLREDEIREGIGPEHIRHPRITAAGRTAGQVGFPDAGSEEPVDWRLQRGFVDDCRNHFQAASRACDLLRQVDSLVQNKVFGTGLA